MKTILRIINYWKRRVTYTQEWIWEDGDIANLKRRHFRG